MAALTPISITPPQSLTPSSSSSPASVTAPTSSNTPTPTTSNAASSAASTSSTASSSSSSSSATTAQTTSSTTETTTSSPTSTSQFLTTNPGGGVETVTVAVSSSQTATSAPQDTSTSSNSFFSNKAAVAGVFAVVGLVVVALAVALIVNAIRRRRAQKFDRDVAEAAAEAAASARSPFDDDPYANAGGKGSGGAYGYSDNSHGTFQLPPLQPQNDHYGMTEMSQYDPYAAGAASLAAAAAVGRSRSRKDSEPGAPGLAGVGAGTLAREPSRRAPYHAFAGPGPQAQDLQGSGGTIRSTRQDVLEAAGLAGPAVATNASHGGGGAFVTRKPSETQNTHLGGRSQFGSMSSGGHHPTTLQPGYPVDSYYPQRSDNLSPDPFATYPPAPSRAFANPRDATLPSPPLPGPQSDHNHYEDAAELGSQTALRGEEQRMSYQDDTDYSQGNRILRVANE